MAAIRFFTEADAEVIQAIYCQAFVGFPWFEQLSAAEVEGRWQSKRNQAGFNCLVTAEGSKIVGAMYWSEPTAQNLADRYEKELAGFVAENGVGRRLIYIGVTVVAPEFQGQGIATALRRRFLEHLQAENRDTLVITRMRDDNLPSIRPWEKLGMKRSGITMPSSQKTGVNHEFWFLVLNQEEVRS